MLAFESLTPQELLKEVAEYIRQQAGREASSAALARTKREGNIRTARANALTGIAMDLEGAGIIPANSILRAMCENCGHSHEDHGEDEQCWNGSGHGNRCDCREYMNAERKAKPFTVGRNDTTGTITRHATLAEAEAQIAEIAKTDPEGVHAGNYYVDGPEELINPPK